MNERLWRRDGLRVHLLSPFGVVVASAVLLVGQPATGQYSSDFEALNGSAAGTVITGQDDYYIPVPNSHDGLVYTYTDNALGLPAHPTGGGEQFAAVTGGEPQGKPPVAFARAQRDVVYNATGVWTVSFDIAVTFVGNLPSSQNIGSFSTSVFPTASTFIALARWTDPATATNWNADYVWYSAAGAQLLQQVGDPDFLGLDVNHWYRWSTTFNLLTNQIVLVSITDLSTGATTTNSPVDKYLVGGSAGGAPQPSGFRLFGGAASPPGNTLAFDNIDIELRAGEASGACCFEVDPCEVLTEADCLQAGGTYTFDWAGCGEFACIPIPEECIDGAGACNEVHLGLGCEDEECCALVCFIIEECCLNEWDQFCVDEAALHGQCIVPEVSEGLYLDQAEFEAALAKTGKVVKGIEDFPWLAPDNSLNNMVDDPLDHTVAIPDWIEAGTLLDNLTYQANIGGDDSSVLAPHGVDALALFTTGVSQATANGLAANYFVDSLDILSGPPAGDNHTALSMTLVTIQGGATVRVNVYDKDNNLIGTGTNLPALPFEDQFLGIIAPEGVTIGRVNIWDLAGVIGAEGVYNVVAYVDDVKPHPCEEWDIAPPEGNGDVGIPDLLLLLQNWGNPYGISDLLAMLQAWGDCPP